MKTIDGITLFDEVWEEEGFWSHESWSVNGDNLTIWKLVVHVMIGTVFGSLLILLWVK
jgi:hypothetical protein